MIFLPSLKIEKIVKFLPNAPVLSIDSSIEILHVFQVTNFLRMSERSILAAYILWFFFGFFGIHRFYLGKICSFWSNDIIRDRPISGLIYLLTAGLCGIGVIEFWNLLFCRMANWSLPHPFYDWRLQQEMLPSSSSHFYLF